MKGNILVILSLYLTFLNVLEAQTYFVAFSSNALSSSGAAVKTDLSGADLYTAFYKPGQNDSVWDIRRITDITNKGEVFPSISPDNSRIAYNYNQKNPWLNQVRLIQLNTGTEHTIFNSGRFPQWINNNELVLSDTADIYILRLEYNTNGDPTIVSTKKITGRKITTGIKQCEDPYPCYKGTKVTFHGYNSTTGSTAICLIDTNSTNFKILTAFSAFGHPVITNDNSEIIGSQASSGQLKRFNPSGFNSSGNLINLPNNPSSLNIYDSRFGSSKSIKWAFIDKGYTDRSFFVSVSGEDASGGNLLSRIFYIEFDNTWSKYTLHDFSTKVELKLGVSGKDFISSSAQTVVLSTGYNECHEDKVQIYPNPSDQNLYFSKALKNFEVFNIFGQLAYPKIISATSISTSGLPEGPYFIRSQNGSMKFFVKH